MRVGIVTKWFNRGQAFVSRYLRDALEDRGHETFILARPTKDKGDELAAHIDRTGPWDQPGVTEASEWEVPMDEYERRGCSATRNICVTRERSDGEGSFGRGERYPGVAGGPTIQRAVRGYRRGCSSGPASGPRWLASANADR
ncbi:MAG: hypothetical protein ACR2K6_10990 [Solirubrobacterales bacterium]|jgi:hypothetical protein